MVGKMRGIWNSFPLSKNSKNSETLKQKKKSKYRSFKLTDCHEIILSNFVWLLEWRELQTIYTMRNQAQRQ